MNDEPRETPLTNFLIAMAHSPELHERFRITPEGGSREDEDERLREEFRLSQDQIEMLRRGNLYEIQEAVQYELPAAGAVAAIWIQVGRWPIPWPWIGA